jgi:hypothetical protein
MRALVPMAALFGGELAIPVEIRAARVLFGELA